MRLDGQAIVVDTNILIHVLRAQAAGKALDAEYGLQAKVPRPIIPVVVKGETKSFAKRLRWGSAKLEALDRLFATMPVADISSSVVIDAYAEIDAYSTSNGRELGKNDAWIAAIARVTGATLLTTDKDFEHLHENGVICVEYVDAENLKRGHVGQQLGR
jgi:tRNA(fMet)-specific endonuclease VapC